MIRIWRDKALAEDFRLGKVTDQDSMRVLLIFIVFQFLCKFPWMTEEVPKPDLISLITNSLVMLITVLGVLHCYKCNEDKKDFLMRFICLCLPLGVKLELTFVAIIFLSNFLGTELTADKKSLASSDAFLQTTQNLAIVPILLASIAFYYFIGKRLSYISQGPQNG